MLTFFGCWRCLGEDSSLLSSHIGKINFSLKSGVKNHCPSHSTAWNKRIRSPVCEWVIWIQSLYSQLKSLWLLDVPDTKHCTAVNKTSLENVHNQVFFFITCPCDKLHNIIMLDKICTIIYQYYVLSCIWFVNKVLFYIFHLGSKQEVLHITFT